MSPPRRLRADVAILGGGPAGLGAAWALAGSGARVVLVEREAEVGGLCRTHVQDGYRFDMGGHRFITADRPLLDRVTRLLGDELLLAERRSEVALLGRRFRYPLELKDLLANLPPRLAARALASYVKARWRRDASPPETFEAWATQRFGRALYELFLGPYTEKVWGVPPAELSAEWASQRISLLDLKDVLRWLLRRQRGRPPRTYAKSFLYPRLGMGQLFTRIGEAAAAGGVETLRGARARGLVLAGRRVQAVELDTAQGPALLEAEHVLSTVPLSQLLSWLPAGRGLAARFPFRPVRFLNLALNRGSVLPVTWRYVGEQRFRAGRLQEPNKRSPFMAPRGRSSLMVEVPHAAGDAIDLASDAELLEQLWPELEGLEVGVSRAELRFAFSVRAPEAYPVHLRGTEAARAEALALVDQLENLRSFGRQGGFRFVFSDACLRMGLDAGAGLLAGATPASLALAQVQSARRLVEVESVVG
ncbi:MAG: FAD-dependent oxidoreductase [Planctomycetota bacterium]